MHRDQYYLSHNNQTDRTIQNINVINKNKRPLEAEFRVHFQLRNLFIGRYTPQRYLKYVAYRIAKMGKKVHLTQIVQYVDDQHVDIQVGLQKDSEAFALLVRGQRKIFINDEKGQLKHYVPYPSESFQTFINQFKNKSQGQIDAIILNSYIKLVETQRNQSIIEPSSTSYRQNKNITIIQPEKKVQNNQYSPMINIYKNQKKQQNEKRQQKQGYNQEITKSAKDSQNIKQGISQPQNRVSSTRQRSILENQNKKQQNQVFNDGNEIPQKNAPFTAGSLPNISTTTPTKILPSNVISVNKSSNLPYQQSNKQIQEYNGSQRSVNYSQRRNNEQIHKDRQNNKLKETETKQIFQPVSKQNQKKTPYDQKQDRNQKTLQKYHQQSQKRKENQNISRQEKSQKNKQVQRAKKQYYNNEQYHQTEKSSYRQRQRISQKDYPSQKSRQKRQNYERSRSRQKYRDNQRYKNQYSKQKQSYHNSSYRKPQRYRKSSRSISAQKSYSGVSYTDKGVYLDKHYSNERDQRSISKSYRENIKRQYSSHNQYQDAHRSHRQYQDMNRSHHQYQDSHRSYSPFTNQKQKQKYKQFVILWIFGIPKNFNMPEIQNHLQKQYNFKIKKSEWKIYKNLEYLEIVLVNPISEKLFYRLYLRIFGYPVIAIPQLMYQEDIQIQLSKFQLQVKSENIIEDENLMLFADSCGPVVALIKNDLQENYTSRYKSQFLVVFNNRESISKFYDIQRQFSSCKVDKARNGLRIARVDKIFTFQELVCNYRRRKDRYHNIY